MKRTHGATRGQRTKEYRTWVGIISRCENPNASGYDRYGARGVRVCERWRRSYADFVADMGPRPSPRHSIDRRDGRGDYTPENCRWATREEQARNKTTTRFITAFGITMCLTDWAAATRKPMPTISRRLRLGMLPEDALMRPFFKRDEPRSRRAQTTRVAARPSLPREARFLSIVETLDADARARLDAPKTCPRGHEYTASNTRLRLRTRVSKLGTPYMSVERECFACRDAASARRRAA